MTRIERASRLPVRLLAAGALAAVAGCAAATMAVPPELGAAERLAVEGRTGLAEPRLVRFGDFAAGDIDRSWTRGDGLAIRAGDAGVDRERRGQSYGFELLESEEALGRVECEVSARRATVQSRVVDVDAANDAALGCRLTPVTGDSGWRMALLAHHDRHFDGAIRAGGRHFRVIATGPGGGWVPAQTMGFEIRAGERVLAAVETVNSGAVWLAPDLEPEDRRVVAGAAAALLLYEPLPTED